MLLIVATVRYMRFPYKRLINQGCQKPCDMIQLTLDHLLSLLQDRFREISLGLEYNCFIADGNKSILNPGQSKRFLVVKLVQALVEHDCVV